MLTKLRPFNWLLPLLLIPVLAYCSSLIQLRQIAAPTTPSLIGSNGSIIGPVTIGAGLSLNGGTLTGAAGVPTVQVTNITASTANSFPIPTGKTVCVAALNGLTESEGADYSVASGIITFFSTPQNGDILHLTCW